MELDAVVDLVGKVHHVDDDMTRSELIRAAEGASQLRAWCEARQARIALLLERVSACPERDVANASNLSQRSAGRLVERGRAAAEVPSFGSALEQGTINAAHVDVLAKALDQVDPKLRAEMADRAAGLIDRAESSTPEQFRKLLAAERDAMAGDHGEARLERQRRARRCRTYVGDDGMWHLHATLDPESGLELAGRLNAQVNAMFAGGKTPPDAPVPIDARQDYLRALALIELMTGKGTGSGVPHLVVVYDETTRDEHGRPRIDWGLDIDLPPSALARLSRRAKVWPVHIVDGEVLAAMGRLDIGREDHLANQAQRRVLRALHPTCGVPGCDVRFDDCQIHHLHWWRHGGRTDLDNLIPLCTRHHVRVHLEVLVVMMTPDRKVTIEERQPTRSKAPPGPMATFAE